MYYHSDDELLGEGDTVSQGSLNARYEVQLCLVVTQVWGVVLKKDFFQAKCVFFYKETAAILHHLHPHNMLDLIIDLIHSLGFYCVNLAREFS